MKHKDTKHKGAKHEGAGMQIGRSLLCVLLAAFAFADSMAQVHLKANLQNMHLWRGMEVTDGAVLTTDLSVADRKNHFRAGIWGGTNTNGSYKEFNNYLSYSCRRFSVAVWDTYNFSPEADYNNKEFFNYKAKETGRFVDATLSYTVSEKFPLFLSWSTILYGRDRDGMNARNRYSTFVYAEYPVFRNSLWKLKPGIGTAFAFSPGKNMDGASASANFYGDTAGVVHLSLTTIYNLIAFRRSFPITVLALWNPQSDKGYLQMGIQLLSF